MKNVALVTGASSGIGKEIARLHAKRGGDLVGVARSTDKLEQLKAELESTGSAQVKVIAKDLADPSAPSEVYDEVKTAGIEVDYLINNAGFGVVYGYLTDNSRADKSATIVSFHPGERRRRYGTKPIVLPTSPGRSRVDLYSGSCGVA